MPKEVEAPEVQEQERDPGVRVHAAPKQVHEIRDKESGEIKAYDVKLGIKDPETGDKMTGHVIVGPGAVRDDKNGTGKNVYLGNTDKNITLTERVKTEEGFADGRKVQMSAEDLKAQNDAYNADRREARAKQAEAVTPEAGAEKDAPQAEA